METLYMNSEKTSNWNESLAQKNDDIPCWVSYIFAMGDDGSLKGYTKMVDFLFR